MSERNPAGNLGVSRRHWSQELYLSVFALFYKIGGGPLPASMNGDAHMGSVGISVVESLILLDIYLAIQLRLHSLLPLHYVAVGIATAGIILANQYFLVLRGRGTDFVEQFDQFSSRKKILLLSFAVCVVGVAAVATYFVGQEYRQVFYGAR